MDGIVVGSTLELFDGLSLGEPEPTVGVTLGIFDGSREVYWEMMERDE